MALRDAPTVISVPNSNVNLEYFGFPGVKAAAAKAGSTTTTLVLNAAAAAVDYFYVGAYVEMIDGGAAGEVVQVVDYDGASQTATVSPAFSVAPGGGDTYNVYGVSGVAQGAPRSDTIVLHSSASATDQFYRGAYLYVQRGVGLGQVRYITAYDGASRTATVNDPWDYLPGPQTTYSIFGEGGTAQAATAGTVTLAAAASATDSWYDGLCLEVLSAGNYAAVGQSARIDSYVGATLEAPFRIVPQAPVVYRVFGGWVGQYETTDGYATAACQVSTGDTEYGALEVAFSMTKTGLNNAGAQVYTREVSVWGQQLVGGVVGTTFHTHNLVSRCFRVAVHTFAHRVIGGCETRLSRHQFPLATRPVEKTLGILQECALTRAVLCGRTGGGGDYRNVHVGISGGLTVDMPKTAFGDLRVTELTPQLQINFTNEVGAQELITFKAGAQSSIRHEVSQYFLRLGDSPLTAGPDQPAVGLGDYAVLRTKKICRYRAGMGGLARFTTVFHGPVAGLWQFAGLATSGNSLEFGYYDDAGVSKFGVNRGRAGRHEIRTIQVSAATVNGTLTLTLPNLLAVGGSTAYSVAGVTAGDNAEIVAERIVADASPTWASGSWDVQNIGSRVIFRSVPVGARAAVAYAFAAGGTGVTLTEVQRVQEGVADTKSEIRELNVRDPATATNTATITLNGVANTVPLDVTIHDTAAKVAWAIVHTPGTAWSAIGGGWDAAIVGNTGTRVRFTSIPQAALGGAYTFAAGGTGVTIDTYIQRQTGQAKQENWTFQEDWNVDPCDGSGPSRFFLNPQKGNVYAVNLQYLGHGQIVFMIEDPGTGDLFPVHKMQLANSEVATTLESPHMPFQAAIYSVNPALPAATYTMRLASISYHTEGRIIHHAPRFAVENYVSANNGKEYVALMLKHPEVYNDGPSLIGAFIQSVTCGINASANDVTAIYVRLNPTITSAAATEPNWELVSYPSSPILLAKSTTNPAPQPEDDISRLVATGGELVFARSTAGNSDWLVDMKDFELNRGDVLVVSFYAYAGTLDISIGVNWIEDH